VLEDRASVVKSPASKGLDVKGMLPTGPDLREETLETLHGGLVMNLRAVYSVLEARELDDTPDGSVIAALGRRKATADV
jgi:hypothetical protein